MELNHLKLIRARLLGADFQSVPAKPGVYLFFIEAGLQLLERTEYFETDTRLPISAEGRVHLYTGAADNLRKRMEQHLRRDYRSSSFRKTLLSIERVRRAVSRTNTPACKIRSEDNLSRWLFENMTIGIEAADEPFTREREIIERHISPFNITLRRRHAYSRRLIAWRSAAFPPWRPHNDRDNSKKERN